MTRSIFFFVTDINTKIKKMLKDINNARVNKLSLVENRISNVHTRVR